MVKIDDIIAYLKSNKSFVTKVRELMGDLSLLKTKDKTNLVGAVNEIKDFGFGLEYSKFTNNLAPNNDSFNALENLKVYTVNPDTLNLYWSGDYIDKVLHSGVIIPTVLYYREKGTEKEGNLNRPHYCVLQKLYAQVKLSDYTAPVIAIRSLYVYLDNNENVISVEISPIAGGWRFIYE